ncbi:uncharacterized protein LOC118504682 [Anopheles stephensi]|uniref:uncharacterized protein LOC118504682 n=1 Tax=Anopheles stephensi TaxID=30069 RepID=UPI001658C1CB|nr:uncharacterized protein LOC118504682 [Anopheles stephensi]
MGELIEKMHDTKDFCFTLHASTSDIGVILKHSVYSIIYQRGISFREGFRCGMYDGVPLMLPCNQKIQAYVDEVMVDTQRFLEAKQISKFMVYIYTGRNKVLERWIFDLQPKDAYDETTCSSKAVPEMSDIVLQITSVACCLPILKKRCPLYFVFGEASHDND